MSVRNALLALVSQRPAGVYRLKQAFEDRTLRIPLGDRELRSDLHKLRKVASPTGAVRFEAERDSDGHADRAWACFLALDAAAGASAPIDFSSMVVSPPAKFPGLIEYCRTDLQ